MTADSPAQATPGSDVFVSYASQDAPIANAIVEALERSGVRCWVAPRDVTPGEFYADAIVGAINASRVLVVVLTENATASPHVLREIERASAKRHPVVSFRIDAAPLPAGLEYFLSASHWLDATTAGVEAALPKLVQAVQRLVAPSTGAEPSGASDTAKPAADLFPHPSATKTRLGLSRPLLAVMAVIAVVVTYLVVDQLWLSKRHVGERSAAAVTPAAAPAVAAISEKSVAVLPFVDMSEKQDQEYFSDGLSEELIDMLTKVPDLRVPARTSSFYFKGKQTTIADIAKALGVAHVLEGSVRKSGRTLRITVQLIRVDNGYHLWSETYERKLDDIFKIQDEIAGAVVKALKVSLIDRGAPTTAIARNADAYRLYLQGRAIDRIADNKAQYDSAAEYLRNAIKADPTFAEAWAFLTIVLTNEVALNYVRGEVVAAEMRHATAQALILNPNLADAHTAAAETFVILDGNSGAALPEYQKAYDIDPTDAGNAYALAGALYYLQGESETVLGLFRKAIELDPVNSQPYAAIGAYYYEAGKLPEAEAAIRKAIDLSPPTGTSLHGWLGYILLVRGRPDEALAEFRREPDEIYHRQGAALAYFALGRRAEADAALAEMERKDALTYASGIAETYAYRGEIEPAFTWLDRAYRQRDAFLSALKRDPLMKSLHADPRWKAFLRKLE